MGKQYRHLWPQIISLDNLFLAFEKAARGKRSHPSVAAFEYHLEQNIFDLRDTLRQGSWQPGGYTSFYIHDPKRRLISAAPFRDRVVHHALVNILEPIYECKFIYDTYANRQGKGTHRALDRCTTYLRRFQYVLPMDVRQFFPSIDYAILLGILEQTITDERVMALCRQIVDSGIGVLQEEYQMVWFPGDDLLAAARPRGLPIGNLTSQFWANVYLNPLDHFIKRELKCHGYIRYVDDMLLFAQNKMQLHVWLEQVTDFLAGLRLTIHTGSAQPRPARIGVPFLGFQLFHDHRRLKRRKAIHARRRLKALAARYRDGETDEKQVQASVRAWIAHAEHGDTWGLRSDILSPLIFRRSGGKIA